MKRYNALFNPEAESDLLELRRYLTAQSGTFVTKSFIDRIVAACLSLEIFPERGTRRDEIRPGLRVIGFERSATIVFRVLEDDVEILRVLYGGRDYTRIFGDPALDE